MLGLGFLYRKAQAKVDNAIAQLVWGALMVVPLFVALGYATAAGSSYLHRHYEPEVADLIVAGIYLAIAAAIGISYALRKPETAASEEAKAQDQADKQADAEQRGESPLPGLSSVDRDILLAALTSAAPYALRPALSAAVRNLPLLLVLAVAAFLLTRPSESAEDAITPPGTMPAE